MTPSTPLSRSGEGGRAAGLPGRDSANLALERIDGGEGGR
jgi:hypothetical protein